MIRLLATTLLLGGLTAAAQSVPQPAESAREASEKKTAETSSQEHKRSWEAPPLETVVTGTLVEEELIGDYQQPRWTAVRRFPTTRIYVIPEGNAQFEYWLETKTPFDDAKATRLRSLFEFEFGLGHHLQLDLYLRTEQDGLAGSFALESERVELRWALADWGKLWGNPTLYFEFIHTHDAPPSGEIKLLLGGQLAPRWHWGANASYERVLGAAEDGELQLTYAVSRTLQDARLSLGAEARLELVDSKDARFDFGGIELLAGPSLQWRPVPAAHLDLVALLGAEVERDLAAGTAKTTGLFQPTVVFGWEF